MKTLDIKIGGHDWEKQNLITELKKGKFCDIFKCRKCGLIVQSFRLGEIEVPEKDYKKALMCRGMRKSKSIKILHCSAFSSEFVNIIPGSVHKIVSPPEGYNNKRGEWVMGITEPVLLLFGEFEYQ